MEQGKILKVVIEYEKVIYIAEGRDAESWSTRVGTIEMLAHTHGYGEWNQWTEIVQK